MWYMFSIQCEELRINLLTPLLVVTMPEGRDTHSWQYKGICNSGVQRTWSEIMNVLANPKGSVGRWNLNFRRLEQFHTNFGSKGAIDTYSNTLDLSKTNKEATVKQ
jgi:hypothetical protein